MPKGLSGVNHPSYLIQGFEGIWYTKPAGIGVYIILDNGKVVLPGQLK